MTKKLPLVLLICLIGLPQISETIYSPALPNVAMSLHTTNNLAQWTMSIFFLGFALGILCWGIWSDSWGRRKSILISMVLYR